MENIESIPWVEKYRPMNFDDIVLDEKNKIILRNIIKKNHFPNLLFYGPPGTGKTTTIINLINEYQLKYNQRHKELMIHLNASDERGIDIVRNQINNFVSSSGLFNKGLKFVVLDEVDYMTKNAQQALKYLLHKCDSNVRFCLICNYISRIDIPLQNEFLRLRFNQLPESEIYTFLKNISIKEDINLTDDALRSIKCMYKSDIRSMINYMQSNQNIINNKMIIKSKDYEKLFELLIHEDFNKCKEHIQYLSITFTIDNKTIIECFFEYLISDKLNIITSKLLNFIENFLHSECYNIEYNLNYFLVEMQSLLNDLIINGGDEDKGIV